jgi:hypothetical protein
MRARAAWAVPVAVAVVALAAVGAIVAWKEGAAPAPSPAAITAQTVTVTTTQLSTTQTLSGTLGYGAAQTLSGSEAGLVTWLPASGVVVSRGQPLYLVNNEPVPLFYGSTPLYRRLDAAGMVGPDVKVVADNLAALGYHIGYQPPLGSVITQASTAASGPTAPLTVADRVVHHTSAATGPGQAGGAGDPTAMSAQTPTATQTPTSNPGTARPSASPTGSHVSRPAPSRIPTAKPSTPAAGVGATPAAKPTPTPTRTPVTATVRQGDGVLTTALMQAIARWQTAEGIPSTGILGIGDMLVEPGPVRVTAIQAQLGSPAAGPLMTVASTAKTVTVDVDSTDVLSVRQSGRVTITLPDGSTAAGTIIAVSSSVQSGQATSDGQPQQTVTVAPDDPSAVASLTSAPVQVTFVGQTANGVLAVPVTALLALSGGGYALQLPGGRLIPVQTGMFAQGMVQVSGPGITAGLRVVTSQ